MAEVEQVPSYTVIAGLKRSNIVSVVEEYVKVRAEIERLEKRKKELAGEGVKILVKAGVKTVMVGELKTTVIAGSSSRISAEALYKLGVSEKIITKATTVTPWTSLKVTLPKENGE